MFLDVEEMTYCQEAKMISFIIYTAHHMNNFDDWGFTHLFDTILNLLNVADNKFIYFCKQYVNLVFRRRRLNEDEEWIDINQECVDAINQGLSDVGLSPQPAG